MVTRPLISLHRLRSAVWPCFLRFPLKTTITQIGVQRHARTRSRHLSIGFVKSTKYAIAASFGVLTVVLFLVATFGRTAPVSSGSENRDSRSGSGESGIIKALSNWRVGNREEDSNNIALGYDAASDAVKAAKAAVEAARAAIDAVKDEDGNSVVEDSTVTKQTA